LFSRSKWGVPSEAESMNSICARLLDRLRLTLADFRLAMRVAATNLQNESEPDNMEQAELVEPAQMQGL